jgi:hypothetical protein
MCRPRPVPPLFYARFRCRSAAGTNNENSALLTASAGNAAFNPRASVPASSVSSLLPSAAAAVAAQSGMQQRFSTQTGPLSWPPTVPSYSILFYTLFFVCFWFSNSIRSHAPPLQRGQSAVGTARRQPHRPNAAGSYRPTRFRAASSAAVVTNSQCSCCRESASPQPPPAQCPLWALRYPPRRRGVRSGNDRFVALF